jgi:hypothetical protein
MQNLLSMRSCCGSRSVRTVVGLAGLVAGNSAWAGVLAPPGSITHGPLTATAVPTMSGFALVLLAALMLLVVARVVKSRQLDGTRFMLVALVTGAIASGVSGIKLVSEAYALPAFTPVSLSDPAGGTLPLSPGENCVTNNTGIAQQILDIEFSGFIGNNGGNVGGPTLDCGEAAGEVPECSDTPPTVLQPGATCGVEVPFGHT